MNVDFTITVNLTKKHNMCMTFKHIKGNDLYYKLLVNKIKEEFLYGEVKEL
jgi:hypothetical protein